MQISLTNIYKKFIRQSVIIIFVLFCVARGTSAFAADTVAPLISKIESGRITSEGYTLYCTVTDDGGVDKMVFETWNDVDGEDHISATTVSAVPSGAKEYRFTYSVDPADYNGRSGFYHTRMCAYDISGNVSNTRSVKVEIPASAQPVSMSVQAKSISSSGFTMTCTLTDDTNVGYVKFPTWTENNGKDDIASNWETTDVVNGTKNGLVWSYQVLTSDHNFESGVYITDVLVYDKNGKQILTKQMKTTVPADSSDNTVTASFKVSDVTASGYMVTCTVNNDSQIGCVKFPTWTEKNGTDDIIPDWENTDAVNGTKNELSWNYYVNVSDHNNESGNYFTRICIYSKSGTLVNEKTLPVIVPEPDQPDPLSAAVQITDIDEYGYDITVTVSDENHVSKVKFPTWTEKDGQDDVQADWENTDSATGIKNGKVWTYHVDIADHNEETGNYITEVRVYDLQGKVVFSKATTQVIPEKIQQPDQLTAKYSIKDLDKTGFTVTCTVSDDSEISCVKFPAWTELNGEDDAPANWEKSDVANGVKEGCTWSYRVKVEDHNYEYGIYVARIYVYDKNGKVRFQEEKKVNVPEDKEPSTSVIASVEVPKVTSSGYQIVCTVADPSKVSAVKFPTWTVKNGEDDIQPEWETSSSAEGVQNGNVWTYYVDVKDHGQESGEYISKILIYDLNGKISYEREMKLTVPAGTSTKPSVFKGLVNTEQPIVCFGFVCAKTDSFTGDLTVETPGRIRIVYEEYAEDTTFELNTGDMTGYTIRAFVTYTLNGKEVTVYTDPSFV